MEEDAKDVLMFYVQENRKKNMERGNPVLPTLCIFIIDINRQIRGVAEIEIER